MEIGGRVKASGLMARIDEWAKDNGPSGQAASDIIRYAGEKNRNMVKDYVRMFILNAPISDPLATSGDPNDLANVYSHLCFSIPRHLNMAFARLPEPVTEDTSNVVNAGHPDGQVDRDTSTVKEVVATLIDHEQDNVTEAACNTTVIVCNLTINGSASERDEKSRDTAPAGSDALASDSELKVPSSATGVSAESTGLPCYDANNRTLKYRGLSKQFRSNAIHPITFITALQNKQWTSAAVDVVPANRAFMSDAVRDANKSLADLPIRLFSAGNTAVRWEEKDVNLETLDSTLETLD